MSGPVPLVNPREQAIATYFADLEAALAPDRLASYRPTGASDLATIATYFWNIALSRDLHLGLGAAEVSMRNGIHNALTTHTGHLDWYDHLPLLPREAQQVIDVKAEIARSGKPVIPGRVVAGLRFGFWTSLLSTGFGPQGYGTALWSPNNAALLIKAFPNLRPPNQYRGYVHARFNTLRLLRNRTMHHEPIWQGMTVRRQQKTATFALTALYADILDAIGWTSPRLRDSVVAFDRFPETVTNGLVTQAKEIENFLGI